MAMRLTVIGGGGADPIVMYGTTHKSATGGSTLMSLDPATGALIEEIGVVGYDVNGLCIDPTDGKMFATTSNGDPVSPSSLLSIDIATGAGTVIGYAGMGINLPTVNSSGDMFAFTEDNDNLISVNKTTGAAINLGDGVGSTANGGMAFDGSDVLWYNNSGAFETMNTTTGASTYISNLGQTAHHGDFHPITDKYWGIDTTRSNTPNLLVCDARTAVIEQTLPTFPMAHTICFGGSDAPDAPDPIAVIIVSFTTDRYPEETGLIIRRVSDGVVVWERTPAENASLFDNSNYEWSVSLPDGDYQFEVTDSFGDGAVGSFEILNGATVLTSGNPALSTGRGPAIYPFTVGVAAIQNYDIVMDYLTPTDGTGTGYRVAISADGNSVIHCAWGDNNWVYFYEYNGISWSHQRVEPATADQSILNVRMSDDGLTAATMSWGGTAIAYTKTAGVWSDQYVFPTLSYDDLDKYESFSLSGDGRTIAIGNLHITGTNGFFWFGEIYMWTSNGSTWTQRTTIINPWQTDTDPADGWDTRFGTELSLSYDGRILAAGCPTLDQFVPSYIQHCGGVRMFTSNDSITWNETPQGPIYAPAPRYSQVFGTKVDLSSDGKVLIVSEGAYYSPSDNADGAVYVYTSSDGLEWTYRQKLIGSTVNGTGLQFGYNLSISQSGTKILIGSYAWDTPEKVWIFESSDLGLTWAETYVVTTSITSAGIPVDPITWQSGGSGYLPVNTTQIWDVPTTALTGVGTGLTVIIRTDASGVVMSSSLRVSNLATGHNYQVGDLIEVTGASGSGATFTITDLSINNFGGSVDISDTRFVVGAIGMNGSCVYEFPP